MKFCRTCGKELDDDAVICTGCGCAAPKTKSPSQGMSSDAPRTVTNDENKKASPLCLVAFILGMVGIFAAILIPILGFILGIVALVLGIMGSKKSPPRQPNDKANMRAAGWISGIGAIAVSIISFIINFIILLPMFL